MRQVRTTLPGAEVEVRGDSAFSSDEIVSALDGAGVESSIGAPFERFVERKPLIEGRRRWLRLGNRLDSEATTFESPV